MLQRKKNGPASGGRLIPRTQRQQQRARHGAHYVDEFSTHRRKRGHRATRPRFRYDANESERSRLATGEPGLDGSKATDAPAGIFHTLSRCTRRRCGHAGSGCALPREVDERFNLSADSSAAPTGQPSGVEVKLYSEKLHSTVKGIAGLRRRRETRLCLRDLS